MRQDSITDKMVQAGRKTADKHGAGAMREIYKAMLEASPAARQGHEARLVYNTCWHAPGYRDLRMVLQDPRTGKTYDFDIGPADLQRVIHDCADAVKQISDHPPLDWDRYRAQIYWPSVTPWMKGPPAIATAPKGGPTESELNRPYCKPDQSCCDFVCGN